MNDAPLEHGDSIKSDSIGHAGDHYTQPANATAEPPRSFRATLKYLGPSVIISATIVGSGEIVLTASLGAAVGYSMLWWVLFSCWSKSILQAELTRYIVLSGDTYFRAINRMPGKIPGPRGPFAWPLALEMLGFLASLTGLGGLIGGAGQAVALLFPGFDPLIAVALLAVLASVVLGSGSYRRLESVMLVFVVTFTVLTIAGALLMQDTEFATRASDVVSGFTFEFSTTFAVLALAAYGYTGVNSSEISAYTYWCIEKGYAARIGRFDDTPEWYRRAHGWLRVLRTDVWVTLLILTCATVPFYVLGAGVLHAMGERPEGSAMVPALSNMYTSTLGPWSLWLFGIGAFAILYSSTLAAIAARARYIPDYLIELGFTTRDRLDLRRAIIRWYCLIVPFIGLGLYVGFQRPVLMVTIAACYAAIMLPVQSGITIYLQAKRLPVQVQPKWPARYFLRLTFVVQLVLACAVIYFVIL
ncbi:MAG TPA: Nramp family divalent metal transporter [Burkholderiales bacterium]|nr:Nramp family divalent metal transporter [Burkholderiales bacterium]